MSDEEDYIMTLFALNIGLEIIVYKIIQYIDLN